MTDDKATLHYAGNEYEFDVVPSTMGSEGLD